jgi:YggT family protein
MQAYLVQLIQFSFIVYSCLLFFRVISSWFSTWQIHQIVRFIAFCTDPYLDFFRRILPPLGGVLDLSPVLAFFALRILEMVIIRLVMSV